MFNTISKHNFVYCLIFCNEGVEGVGWRGVRGEGIPVVKGQGIGYILDQSITG